GPGRRQAHARVRRWNRASDRRVQVRGRDRGGSGRGARPSRAGGTARRRRDRRSGPAVLMGRRVVLLRGINLGPNRRVPMAELRELFATADFADVRTYVQSGNVVLSSDAPPQELADQSERLIAERFGFDVP